MSAVTPRAFRCALVLLLLATSAGAQTVRGRLTTAQGAPAGGAFVVLQDSAGTTHAAMIADTLGRFQLRAPRAGTFSLRIERLALRTHTTDPFTLAVGQTHTRDVQLAEQAITLDALAVRAERRGCRVPGELSAQAATLWEEARKALAVSAWSARQPLRMMVRRSLRERPMGGRRTVLEVADSSVREASGSLWGSAPPAELATLGFVRSHGAGFLYYGPDAHLLLSDEFLATHCFRVEEHDSIPEQIGLAFAPLRQGARTDIRGVLWLAREPLRLSSLEFRYVGLPYRVDEPVGGSVRFHRLDDGMWIIEEWAMQVPRAAEPGSRTNRAMLMSEHRTRVVDALDRSGKSVLGARAEPWRASDVAGQAADLPVPGGRIAARLWAVQACGRVEEGRVHVVGYVENEQGGPVEGARIIVYTARGEELLQVETTSADDGLFRACNVRAGGEMRIEADSERHLPAARSMADPTSDVVVERFRLFRRPPTR